jgi:hypothetical protein
VGVEVRFVEGCPSVPVIRQRLRHALDAIGCAEVDIRFRQVRTDAEAHALGFTGSPTILVDGNDLFGQPDAVVGLSCRLYRCAHGTTGSPRIEQLTAALGGNRVDRPR